MGRSRNKHSGTKHTTTIRFTRHHHHENKRDIAEERALEQIRREQVAILDKPLPEVKELIPSDQISQTIREVVGDDDAKYQLVWQAVAIQGLNDLDAIRVVAEGIKTNYVEEITEFIPSPQSEVERLLKEFPPLWQPDKPRHTFNTHFNLHEFKESFKVDSKPRYQHNYRLTIGCKCPRCIGGRIVKAWRSRVCINCGCRDDDEVRESERKADRVLWWLIRNRPSETPHDPLKRIIYIGSKFVGSMPVSI